MKTFVLSILSGRLRQALGYQFPMYWAHIERQSNPYIPMVPSNLYIHLLF